MFDGMSERNVRCSRGTSRVGVGKRLWRCFRKMIEIDVGFDMVTLVWVLTTCGRLTDIELGEWVYEYAEGIGLKGNPTLVTSLIDMYSKCDHVDTARKLFDQMPQRDVVAWIAMITGYSQASQCREALSLFHEM